ncbi:MAG: DASH family cryptochrome [Saprospiraceae bacterium]|nr:DASH family cryptochrome [Saprospiraceae bacterium]
MENRAIVWFRNDLRIHDNEALTEAINKKVQIIPVYVFDERIFKGKTSYGFDKIQSFRTQFIIESVEDLRKNLRIRGADLLVRMGKPEEIIFELAKTLKTQWVYCNRERTYEEVMVQDKLEHKLWTIGQEIRYTRGKMLYYTSDLPFPITQTPESFTAFKKEVEKIIPVRKPVPVPETVPYMEMVDPGIIPDLDYFGKKNIVKNHIENNNFCGGESAGLAQLNYYLNEKQLVKNYFETRNDLFGWEFSSKLSPWLAAGCLSPKKVFEELKKFEINNGENKSTYWLYFELLWRDFFRLMGKKHGNNIFKSGGIKNRKPSPFHKPENGLDWVHANTGEEIIDACILQLKETGYSSNRARQLMASYLVNDLKGDWRMGAEFFESYLIDYDPCSNYGNWNYLAGIGNDSREERCFNPKIQAQKYDPDGKFVSYWTVYKKTSIFATLN